MKRIIHSKHSVKYRHQDLLKKHADANPQQKCNCPHQDIFFHIKSGNLFFIHPKQQIGSEFTASFFQHKPRHIADQPCKDAHDKHADQTDHRPHHPRFPEHGQNVRG